MHVEIKVVRLASRALFKLHDFPATQRQN